MITPFRLFVYPNRKVDVEGASTLNRKLIYSVIYKLQEVLFTKERSVTSRKGMIAVKLQRETEVICVDGDGNLHLAVRLRRGLGRHIL